MGQLEVARRGRGRPRTRPARVLADKAYSSRAIRSHLRRRGIRATISEPADQIRGRLRRGTEGGCPPAFDPQAYKQRNTVERAFNRLRQHRAVATRYDKRDFVYRGTVDVAAIRIWLRDLTQQDLRDTPQRGSAPARRGMYGWLMSAEWAPAGDRR
jgi:transposase